MRLSSWNGLPRDTEHYCFRKINHLGLVPFAFILCVREAVSGTLINSLVYSLPGNWLWIQKTLLIFLKSEIVSRQKTSGRQDSPTVSEKKHDRSAKKTQFLRHKSYSNVTRILCISIIMIFNCFPIIFWLFRQVDGHIFFFSLLTAFAIHTDNQEIHKCRSFFAKAKPMFKVAFTIFSS
jgi:hypothetical protein